MARVGHAGPSDGSWAVGSRASSRLVARLTDAIAGGIAIARTRGEPAAVVLLIAAQLVLGWHLAQGHALGPWANAAVIILVLSAAMSAICKKQLVRTATVPVGGPTPREQTERLDGPNQAAAPLAAPATPNVRPLASRQPLAEWSALMSQVSHELRTPLNAVIGFSEVMDAQIHGPLGHAKYQEYASHIRASGSRLLKSTEDTLAMAALVADLEQTREQRVRLDGAIKGAVEQTARHCHLDAVAIDVDCPPDIAVRSDARGLQQALANLLVAAVLLSANQSAITIRVTSRGGIARLVITVEPALAEPLAPAGQDGGPGLAIQIARLLLELLGQDLRVTHDHVAGRWRASLDLPLCQQPALFELDAA